MTTSDEVFISVDVETAGPIPGIYSLLSIGACRVDEPTSSFACQLKPINRNADPEALLVTGLSLDALAEQGLPPDEAMRRFEEWISVCVAPDEVPVLVGLNAPFDWSFVNYYFHRFLGHNPFGFSAVDIKAYYMGQTGCQWRDTASSDIAASVNVREGGTHDALTDATYQADLFRRLLDRGSGS